MHLVGFYYKRTLSLAPSHLKDAVINLLSEQTFFFQQYLYTRVYFKAF